MNTLLILTPDAADYVHLLQQQALPDLQTLSATETDAALPLAGNANILLGTPTQVAAVLPYAPRLEWVQSTFAGVDLLCKPGLRTDYTLCNVRGVFAPLMSEYVFGHILALERDLLPHYQQQQARLWQALPYRGVRGLTLGVAGLGSIGQHLAATGKHFGMRVVGLRRQPVAVPDVDQIYGPEALAEFLAQADYVVNTLPSTPATRHLFNAETLRHMNSTAVLINVGRGSTVDETALIDALASKRLRGAVLDVFEQEPLAPESPLWGMEHVRITPHTAAVSVPEQVVGVFADNYRRFVQGLPLQYRVDFAQGY